MKELELKEVAELLKKYVKIAESVSEVGDKIS